MDLNSFFKSLLYTAQCHVFIQVYTPTIGAEKERVGEFYDQVQLKIYTTCKHDVLLAIGDRNVTVGNMKEENIVQLYGLGNCNGAGDQRIHFHHSYPFLHS